MQDFRIKITQTDPKNQVISLHGYFDESAEFPESQSFAPLDSVIFDFDGCSFINSGGIKKWVLIMAELASYPNLKLVFRNCRPMVVDQLNMVEGFLPEQAKVESIYLAFYCEKCERELNLLRKVTDIQESGGVAIDDVSDISCENFPDCKKYIDLDFDPKKTLGFLKRSKRK